MTSFSKKLLKWFHQHGRKNLPWQQQPTPYRVWISEIMLQQTQVQTVIPYFEKFMQSFPDLETLAAAPLDDVLHHWSGLGYYARARNLHKAAQQICDQYSGQFPDDLDNLQQLPGIGRSTAGAILSLAFQQRQPILDGNVKRVLTRFHAIEGWPGKTDVQKKLWKIADQHTPEKEVAAYTQAIMDLGATLCTRSKPRCEDCPMQTDCEAKKVDRQKDFPFSKPKKTIPTKKKIFLILVNDQNEILLEKRPPTGIWGGLWSLPECGHDVDPEEVCEQRFACKIVDQQTLETVRHTFSHFHLEIRPQVMQVAEHLTMIMESDETLWYNNTQVKHIGLAAPVASLLKNIEGKNMTRMVNCIKLGKEAEAMKRNPYPGDLGIRIFENVSQEAWQLWLGHQTMLINENRLTPIEPKDRKFLEEEMEKFFFGEGSEAPEGYVAPV